MRINPLWHGERVGPASWLAESGALIFNRRRNLPATDSPRLPLRRCGLGPGAGSDACPVQRVPSPPCPRSGPLAVSAPGPVRLRFRSGPSAVPVPVRYGPVWPFGPVPAGVVLLPIWRSPPVLARLLVQRGHFRKQPRFFAPRSSPHTWKKFTGNPASNPAAKIPTFAIFDKESPEILCKNNSPRPP